MQRFELSGAIDSWRWPNYFLHATSHSAHRPSPHSNAEAEAANKKPRNAESPSWSYLGGALRGMGKTFDCSPGPLNPEVERMGDSRRTANHSQVGTIGQSYMQVANRYSAKRIKTSYKMQQCE